MPDPAYVHAAFSSIAERYVTANHILSMGTDIMWRARVVQMVAEWKPANLLDIATGTGDLALAIKRALPEIEVLGTDFCRPMLDVAVRRGLTHVLEADAMNLPLESASYEAATVAFGLRNMADYGKALCEFRRVLKPGGHLLVLDFSMPENIFAAPYRLYLHHVLPRIAGWVTGNSGAYDYLGDSIEAFPRGESFLQLLRRCGYKNPSALPLCMGIASIYTAEV
ncbi:MAG: ubiquinone/menaquinone biosynthesis methyltransferase [Akkermansiaceae bacterium]|nr:ubiquinone/menaquinone biosynthesis methyltransferase [Akkermansiaceae bacterium]